MKSHYSKLLILAACTTLTLTACGNGTTSDSSGSDLSSVSESSISESSDDGSSDTSSSEDSSSGSSSSESSSTANATITVFDDYPSLLDIGDTVDLDDYVYIGDESDYTAEVTSGEGVVSVTGHTVTATSYGEYTITLTSSYETATVEGAVNSATKTAFEDLFEVIDNNYEADLIYNNYIYRTISHAENYWADENYISSSYGGIVKLGNGYGYTFDASSNDFSDPELNPGAYVYDNLVLSSSFPVDSSALIDLYNSSGDVLIDGDAAYYLPYYTVGYNLYSYGVEFYALTTVESEGETYYWFVGYSGNDTDGYTNTGYAVRIHAVNEVSIASLEQLIALNNIPGQWEHDALTASFATINYTQNYTLNLTAYYYDSTNSASISNTSATAVNLAAMGFGVPYSAVSYVNEVSYYSEILSGYVGDEDGMVYDIAGDVYAVNQYTTGGVTDTATLILSHENDEYTFVSGSYTDEYDTAWETSMTPSSITTSALNKVNFLNYVSYSDDGIYNYQYTFNGLLDDGAFLEALIKIMPVYGESVWEYFASYEDEDTAWWDVYDSDSCVIACTEEGDIYGQIATYGFRVSSTQSYRYVIYFEITDIGDTIVDNEYLAAVDWSQVQ